MTFVALKFLGPPQGPIETSFGVGWGGRGFVGQARRIGRKKQAVTQGQGRGDKRAVDVCEVQVEAVLLVPRLLDLRVRGWRNS